MNKIKSIVLLLFILSCNSNKNTIQKNENLKIDSITTKKINNKISLKSEKDSIFEFDFSIDDVFSEGSEGKIYFVNDTTIAKIQFSYATSMKMVDQDYLFLSNKLVRFKQVNNYLNLDKTGYSDQDSLSLKGDEIINNPLFDNKLYKALIDRASSLNPKFKW